MQAEQIKQLIEAGIPGCQAIVKGDGDHFEATVISEAFAGLGMVKQHQRVYAALGNLFQADLHALALRTFTPEQWQQQRPQ
ncbi:MAG: BolA family protein [Gammaproteobacteria bacterium]